PLPSTIASLGKRCPTRSLIFSMVAACGVMRSSALALAAPAQFFEQRLIEETVLRPADGLLKLPRGLSRLQPQHTVYISHVITARLQQGLQFLALVEAQQRLVDGPFPLDAAAAQYPLTKIGNRERVTGGIVVLEYGAKIVRDQEGRALPSAQNQ